MTQALILLCILAAMVGLPLGYFLGFLHTEADRLLDAYLAGGDEHRVFILELTPEVWR